jgi:GWxTD domain-containing protein
MILLDLHKNKITWLRSLWLMALLFSITACTSVQQTQNAAKNFSFKYNPSANPLLINYLAYHQDDTITQIYFSIDTRNLGFLPVKDAGDSYAYLELKAEIFQEGAVSIPMDTLNYQLKLQKQESTHYVSNFPLKLKPGSNYRLNLSCLDRFRSVSTFDVLMINRVDSLHYQNFMFRKSGYLPLINGTIQAGDSVQLYSRYFKADTLFVAFLSPRSIQSEVPFGAPRNVVSGLKIDTIMDWNYRSDAYFKLENRGVYHFSTDQKLKGGIRLLVSSQYFPEMRTAEEYLLPLKYLTANREYRDLLSNENPKQALDSFWLTANSTLDRAKELIRIYYSRAAYANRFFTSSTEGWESDRGMIYLIFGPPRTVLVAPLEERWIYGDTGLPSLDFTFYKVEVPGFGSDFILHKQEIYKSSWYQAVDSWRNGRAYSIY